MAHESPLKRAVDDFKAGRLEQARKALRVITKLEHSNETAWLWYAHIVENDKQTVEILREYLELNPDSLKAQEHLDIYLSRLHRTQAAQASLRQANDQHSRESDVGEADSTKAGSISELLEIARRDLLDLGLRNPLLKYRLLKARGLELVEFDAQAVFDTLVSKGRTLSFAPVPETVEENGAGAPASTRGANQGPGNRGRRRALQTIHTAADLDKRLLHSYRVSRTYMEEQGVNVLFLAFGMLKWYEAPTSNDQRFAPLVLVPVTIGRTDVRSQFRITYTEEDIGYNLSLQSKLKQDFGLVLPELGDEADAQLDAYYDEVADAVKAYERWEINRSSIVVGFFSFSTFLMYNDLLEESWTGVNDITQHKILNALLDDRGFQTPGDALPDDVFVDDLVDPKDTRIVLDADSSQITAMLEINRGHNMVIQGPPGTGKSQTITNVIAESLGRGKRVLFVAEKMAALEVVKRRLDKIGLGKTCLELHSHKTSKRAVLTDLRETWDLGRPQVRNYAVDLRALLRHRDRLNDYSQAVNSPIGESGLSPHQCFGNLLSLNTALAKIEVPDLLSEEMARWSRDTYTEVRAAVGELEALLQRMGLPDIHPFWATNPPILTPASHRRFLVLCTTALETLSEIGAASDSLSSLLRIEGAANGADSGRVAATAQRIVNGPDLAGVDAASVDWHDKAEEIEQCIRSARRLQYLHQAHDEILGADAWSADVEEIRAVYSTYSHKLWRMAVPDYRRARKALSLLCEEKLPRGASQQLDVVEAIHEAQELHNVIESLNATLSQLYGDLWCKPDQDWDHLEQVAGWLRDIYIDIEQGALPSPIVTYLAGAVDKSYLQQGIDLLRDTVDAHTDSIQAVLSDIELDETSRFGDEGAFLVLTYSDQYLILADWQKSVGRIQEMVTYNGLAKRLRQAGVPGLAEAAAHWRPADRCLVALYDRTWYEGLLSRATEERHELALFDGDTHSHCIGQFCELDRLQFQFNRARLADGHWERLPERTREGQTGVLLREFEKKRRHLPIRKLMARAGNAIQAIKPVFMMSPRSIPAYLPPGGVEFDLVIFDEASQVKPADALGAILRGKQVVVTGDSKQLPPTTFFQNIGELDVEEESPTGDMESILGLFRAQGAAEKTLNWHYRSRHSSLIAVSNYEFYDNRLVVFPSPDDSEENAGLVFHYVSDAVYDRGKSRTNPREAEAVAKAVMLHAHEQPEWTLGVAAFSMSQMRAIQDQVELLRKQNPEYEHFFNAYPHEPFFIKNLENVQGDERDVILISVGYGPDAAGRISINFGPINKVGGERRLNVLITRARHRCEVFSSIRADDIDLSRTQALGVKALKRFLKYAESRDLDVPELTGREPDSAFEEDVGGALSDLGYAFDPQVGSAGFFIDLAVKDSQHPGRYVLGIECDGASYHSARSARDRDRLRQEVLERLGWRIHRIWSTDWFHNRDREIRRLTDAIRNAQSKTLSERAGHDPETVAVNREQSSEQIQRFEMSRPRVGARSAPYKIYRKRVRYSGPLHEVPPYTVALWVKDVVDVESPIHIEELIRRITHAAGVMRSGSRIQKAVRDGVRQAQSNGSVVRKGDFVWKSGGDQPRVRDRSKLPITSRKIEMIAPEEIAEAIKMVVGSSMGIFAEDVASAACTRLGFGRAGALIVAAVQEMLGQMLADGVLSTQNGYVVLAERV